MQNKPFIPDLSAQVRMCASFFLYIVTGLVLPHFHSPYVILGVFFIVQIIIKCATTNIYTVGVSFKEAVLVGPVKVLTSILMIMSGIPEGVAGLLWIGVAVAVGGSGIKNLIFVFQSVAKQKPEATHHGEASPSPEMVTARQYEKKIKAEEHLLSDLAEFLTKSPDKK